MGGIGGKSGGAGGMDGGGFGGAGRKGGKMWPGSCGGCDGGAGGGSGRGMRGGALTMTASASGEGDALSDSNGGAGDAKKVGRPEVGGAGGTKTWPGMCGGRAGEGGGAKPSTVLP